MFFNTNIVLKKCQTHQGYEDLHKKFDKMYKYEDIKKMKSYIKMLSFVILNKFLYNFI